MFHTAYRTFITGQAEVGAIIGERMYPRVLRDKSALPALVYRVISNVGMFAHDGPLPLRNPRVQVDAYALTTLEAEALADAVTTAMLGYRGPMPPVAYTAGWRLEDSTDILEEETGLHRVSMDFRGWYDADEEVS